MRCLFVALSLTLFAGESVSAESDWWQRLGVRDLNGIPLEVPGRWIVVVFLSPECPVANAAVPVLNALATEFGPRGFTVVGAYVDPTIDAATLRQHAHDYRLVFATTDDRAHRLVGAMGATYTPEVFVFARDGTRLYRGRIDNRVEDFGAARPAATRQDLRDVLVALTEGRAGPFGNQPGFGCAIPEAVSP